MNSLMQLVSAMKNPRQFAQNMMKNSEIMQNPMKKNAIEMMQKEDYKGMEQMARNICKQRGINPYDAISQIRQQIGM